MLSSHPMSEKVRFKIGQVVIANSFAGPKIKGIFRGKNISFGALVWGSPINSDDTPSLWKCAALSIEPVKSPKPYETRGAKPNLKQGDPCTSFTSNHVKISGFFVQYEGQYAWIRGWPEGRSRFESPEAFRVLRESLRHPKSVS